MWFWGYMLCMSFLVLAAMIFGGLYMEKRAAKSKGRASGFRSALSTRNDDTWKFANEYCGRLWRKMGLLLLLPTIAAQLPFIGADQTAVGICGVIVLVVQCAALIGTIFPVQRALNRTFYPDGTRRTQYEEP